MRHDYSTERFQTFGRRCAKVIGDRFAGAPQPAVALFFEGGPFLRLRPKRALQERRKSGAFSERCNCKPAQIVTRGQRQLLAFFRAGCGLYLQPVQYGSGLYL